MRAREFMRQHPAVVTPGDTIASAAELMHYETDACVPVVRHPATPVLVGVITARDIVVRCVARGHGGSCHIRDHMTPMPLQTVTPDEDFSEVIRKMEEAEVRRLPVVSDDGLLLGIVCESDLGETLKAREIRRQEARQTARSLAKMDVRQTAGLGA
jgi:CBS domain-containing protein